MADVKKIVDDIMQMAMSGGPNITQNYLDTAYGANRTLNGMTGGGLDYLGAKYGFDSKMSGYLGLLPEQERLKREELAKYLQVGGTLLPSAWLLQGLGTPFNSLMVNVVRWNGRRNLVNQLRSGKNFKDINFGKINDDTMNQINDLRRNGGFDELSGNSYIPANVVRKFYNKRLSEGYTPESMARMGKRLFHEGKRQVTESQYPHIQQITNPRKTVNETGFVSQNPANGQTVIKTMFKVKK